MRISEWKEGGSKVGSGGVKSRYDLRKLVTGREETGWRDLKGVPDRRGEKE